MSIHHWLVWAFFGALVFYCLSAQIQRMHVASMAGVAILCGPFVWALVGFYTFRAMLMSRPPANLQPPPLPATLDVVRRNEDLELALKLIVADHHDERGDTVLGTHALKVAEILIAGGKLDHTAHR